MSWSRCKANIEERFAMSVRSPVAAILALVPALGRAPVPNGSGRRAELPAPQLKRHPLDGCVMFRILPLSVLLLVPGFLAGQRLTPMPSYVLPAHSSGYSAPRFDRATFVGEIPQTYWLEGGVIGGLGVGVLGALYFRGLGESGDRTAGTVAGFVLGGAVGFTAGALIGGQFRKASHQEWGS